MKKILIVITTGFCSYGGLTAVAMNYYRNMDKENLNIDFCSDYKLEPELGQELRKNGSRYYILPKRKKNIISYCIKLKKIINENKYDIIHVHGNSATMFFELEVAKLCKVPIRIAHGHAAKSNYTVFHKLLSGLFYSTYTYAIAVSKKSGDWLYGGRCYNILNNAIDVGKYKYNPRIRNEIRKKYNIENYFVIGNVGKLNNSKNQKFLIEIFNQFHKYNPLSKLMIVGDGELREDIEKMIYKYKLDQDVILTGMKNNVQDYLQAMDVFVFTSIFEGFGMALIEAQACGLYCFSSDVVPYETKVTDNIEYMSLNSSAYMWAKKISDHNYFRREDIDNIEDSIKRNGFDISKEASKLRSIYIK